MIVTLLKDLCEDCVDAVIVSEKSTATEIQLAIDKMKQELDKKDLSYCWEDLLDCMPDDCIVFDRWSDLESIYY